MKQKFILASLPGPAVALLIADYTWWANNETDIVNWIKDNLPRGIDHQQGMFMNFDSEQQRDLFLLRWS